jgi:hypothetical protein
VIVGSTRLCLVCIAASHNSATACTSWPNSKWVPYSSNVFMGQGTCGPIVIIYHVKSILNRCNKITYCIGVYHHQSDAIVLPNCIDIRNWCNTNYILHKKINDRIRLIVNDLTRLGPVLAHAHSPRCRHHTSRVDLTRVLCVWLCRCSSVAKSDRTCSWSAFGRSTALWASCALSQN